MLNVFIFSNAFVAKTLIHSLCYLLNEKVENVYVLGENHKETDFQTSTIDVVVHNDVEYCIQKCDLVLIINDENIPLKSQKYIATQCEKKGKKYITINNPWNQSLPSKDKTSDDLYHIPLVLVVAFGLSAQLSCTEILINQLFCEEQVPIRQLFSCTTMELLKQLEYADLLNEHLKKQIHHDPDNPCVAVFSINIEEDNTNQIKKTIDFVRGISPDFVVLQANNSFDFNKVKTFFECSIYSEIDLLIRSNFIQYNANHVYCKNISDCDSFYIESCNLKEKIAEKIFSKIALPEGCTMI